MTRSTAGIVLGLAAGAAALLSGGVHPLLPLVCLAGFVLQYYVLEPGGRYLPDLALALLHTALLAGAFYTALLRAPLLDMHTMLLGFGVPFLLLVSLGRATPYRDFLKVLVSLLLVVLSAAVARGLGPLAIVAGYLLVACQALPPLAARPREPKSGVSVRLLSRPGFWRHAQSLTSYHLALAGLLLGGLIYLLMPRPEFEVVGNISGDAEGLATRRGDRTGTDGVGRHVAGFPREVTLGDLGALKQRPGIVFEAEVRYRGQPFTPDASQQEILLMRARAWDIYDPNRRRWRRRPAARHRIRADGILRAGAAEFHWAIRLGGYDGKTLFMPPRVYRVRAEGSPTLFINALDVVTSPLPVRQYRVESATPTVLDRELKGTVGDFRYGALTKVPRGLRSQLEPFLPPRASRSLYSSVRAVRAYFDSGQFQYTLQLPKSLPKTKDPMVAFLERREGHCELYASAACMFLRMMDVPARLAGGVRCSERVRPGVYRARFRNAHAWVEIAVRGRGFVALDFTPADSTAADSPAGEADRNEDLLSGRRRGASRVDWGDPFAYDRRQQEELRRIVGDALTSRPVLGLLGASVALLLAALGLAWWRSRPRDPLRVSASRGVPRRTLAFYARWLHACAAAGHRRRRNQTPREFLVTLPPRLRAEGEPVTAEFERVRYGSG